MVMIFGYLLTSQLSAQTQTADKRLEENFKVIFYESKVQPSSNHFTPQESFIEKVLKLCFAESQDFEDALHSTMVSR